LEHINKDCPYEDSAKVYTVSLDFSRFIDNTKIDVGQSVAIFAQNSEEDVLKCIEAFKWRADELIGNKTLKELLVSDVDIRSEKVNLKKLDVKIAMDDDHISLLEIAEKVLERGLEITLPQYIVEESSIIPRIKPRFYSIINDPFVENMSKTNRLSFLFSDTTF